MGSLNSRATSIAVAAVITLCAAVPTISARQPATAAPEPTTTTSACAEPAEAGALRTALGPVLRDEIAGYERAARSTSVDVAVAERALTRVRAGSRSTASDAGIAKADLEQAERMSALIDAAQRSAQADRAALSRCGAAAQRHLTARSADRAHELALDGLRATRAQWRAHLRWDAVTRDAHRGHDDALAWVEAVRSDRAVLDTVDESIAALTR